MQSSAMELEEKVLGIKLHMSHGEALGNTGGDQTTVLEAKINGCYIGKFDNRATFMNAGKVIRRNNIDDYFPDTVKPYYKEGSGMHKKDKPHAEDLLMAALQHQYAGLKGNWQSAYPRAPGQSFDLLSIKIDKSPCPDCASNLLFLTNQYGLKLRVKASVLHTGKGEDDQTGAKILNHSKIPVRHWTVAKLENYIGNKLDKNLTQSTTVDQYKQKNNNSTNQFPLGTEAEKGWAEMKFGRKSGWDNWG